MSSIPRADCRIYQDLSGQWVLLYYPVGSLKPVYEDHPDADAAKASAVAHGFRTYRWLCGGVDVLRL